MSSKRQVTLKLTTQKDLIKHESEARTFGELKAELKNVKWDGMRVVERSSKNTLQMDDAILPATDFILFLVPEKVKAGAEKKFDVEKASYNELRSKISFLNKMKGAKLSMDGKVDELRKTLKKYLAKNAEKPEQKKAENQNVPVQEAECDPIEAIENCRKGINEAIDSIIAAYNSKPNTTVQVEDTTEYVVKTSVDDLEDEVEQLKKSLKL